MRARRTVFIAIAGMVAFGLVLLLARLLGAGGWSPGKCLFLLAFAGAAPWLGLGTAHALVGFAILAFCPDPVAAVFPIPHVQAGALPPVAVAVTIRDEAMATVLPPLRRLLDELDAGGQGAGFALFILSDTQDSRHVAAEQAAIAAFAAADRLPGRVRYRRRTGNAGYKAGNIMDFLDHHADGFELALTLDADSQMSAIAVLRLAHAMQADPTLGLVQHLTVGLPIAAAFPRLFQFGMRAGMRVWATAQSWWQGNEGPYWGHNAMIRIAPFRAHCRLPSLPDGRAILSHDQVEAVRLRAAGWGVRLLTEEAGSQELNPPALPEFMRRELRWMEGNLQYVHLLGMPGLRPMGRWQLLQAILLFASAPLYTAMLAIAAAAALGTSPHLPGAPALGFLLLWWALIAFPKLLGYLQVLASRGLRRSYGGTCRVVAGVVLETLFTLLLDPVMGFAKTLCLLRVLLRRPAAWPPQNRDARGVGWVEATRLLWPHTLYGFGVLGCLAAASWVAAAAALPFAGGLVLAIPFCVATAHPRAGAWLAARGLAAMPEEVGREAHPASPASLPARPAWDKAEPA